jgi:AmmeMemoRadiSam system protein A
MLDQSERETLLAIARAAVVARVGGQDPSPVSDAGWAACGAFVTLRIDGTLRGCLGHITTDQPLADTVQRMAMAAATEDPRFPPMRPEELDAVRIEISVLGPPEPCADPADLEVGRHGVVVEDGEHRGLLLPQVAVEWGWDGQTFLSQACVKAGLRPDAWRSGARVFRFEAEVFEEDGPPPSALSGGQDS